jgi:hypothetical protein
MTRAIGVIIYACPACDRPYSGSWYSSINFSGWREWSDGFAFGDLYKPDPGPVLRCPCGALHLRGTAPKAGSINYDDYIVDRPSRSFWGRLAGRRPPDPPSPPERPPYLDAVSPDESGALLAERADKLTPDIEIGLRRTLWRGLNEPFHDVDQRRSPERMEWPQAGKNQVENLERLIALLRAREEPLWREIGEAERELGHFDAALEAFGKTKGHAVDMFLTGMATWGDGRVVRVDSLLGFW